MKIIFCIILIVMVFGFKLSSAQTEKIEYYQNGQKGIEMISKSKLGLTVIVSTYKAKLSLKNEVAKLFFSYYQEIIILQILY